MTDATSDSLAELMAAYAYSPDVQVVQTAFREQLADAWGIEPGWRVLEVGCGQGDMTAVLADRVGAAGHVTAIDPAPGSYGSPVNLADSTAHLLRSRLGDRIDFRLDCDLLTQDDLTPGSYDAVVFAHCSWYFASTDRLVSTLRAAGRYAPALRLSEWDLTPTDVAQVPHLLAVTIRAEIEAGDPASEANVRNLLSRVRLLAAIEAAGWTVENCAPVVTAGLQDAGWEISQVLADADKGWGPVAEGARLADLVETQVSVLRELVAGGGYEPLPAVAVKARW